MLKRVLNPLKYLKFKDNYPSFTLGTFIVMIVCSFLIVFATFSEISIMSVSLPELIKINPLSVFNEGFVLSNYFHNFHYIPQIPIVLFIGALIGPRFGLIALALYFLAGVSGLPVFAMGGGFNYFENVTFGYILGYFAGLTIVAKLLESKISSISLAIASFAGVMAIHVVGLIYLVSSQMMLHVSPMVIGKWAMLLSVSQITYDIIISFALIALARPIRSILWIAMD